MNFNWGFSLSPKSGSPLKLSNNAVDDTAAADTVVGGLSAGAGSWTYSLSDNAGGQFAISGSNLVAGTGLNHGTSPTPSITVNATDGTTTLINTFVMNVRAALPALPIAAGARLAAIGDSHLGYNNADFGNTVSTDATGRTAYSTGVGMIEWARRVDPRFRFDNWYDTADPISRNFRGANEAKAGDHMYFSTAGYAGGTFARLPGFLTKTFDILVMAIGTNTISSNDDGQFSLSYMINAYEDARKKIRNAGRWLIPVTIYPRGDWPVGDVRHDRLRSFNDYLLTLKDQDGILDVLDANDFLWPSQIQATQFFLGDKVHLNYRGAKKVGVERLLPILQAAVSPGSFINTDPAVGNLYTSDFAHFNGTAGTFTNFTAAQTGAGQAPSGMAINRGRNVSVVASIVNPGDGWNITRLDYTPYNGANPDNGAYFELNIQSMFATVTLDPAKWYRSMMRVKLYDGNCTTAELRWMIRQGTTNRTSGFSGQRLSSDTFVLNLLDQGAGEYILFSEPFQFDPSWGTQDRLSTELRFNGPRTAGPGRIDFYKPKLMEDSDPRGVYGYI